MQWFASKLLRARSPRDQCLCFKADPPIQFSQLWSASYCNGPQISPRPLLRFSGAARHSLSGRLLANKLPHLECA